MGPLAHLDPDSGEVHWNPAIIEELGKLHILESEEEHEDEQEECLELEAQDEEEEDQQEGDGLDQEGEEDENTADHRRDEDNEY